MTDNMLGDMGTGVSQFNIVWKILFAIDLLGWLCVVFAGLTGLLPIAWFVWVIPLSVILLVKASLGYFDSMDDTHNE